MHRSKLSTFVIDCKTDDMPAAARFWSAALRREVAPPHPDYPSYRVLSCAPGEPMLMLQRVEHDSRVHLDIESEDIDAEVARLEALGARKLERVRSWVVMEAPTGQRFCVVRPQRPTHTPPPFEPALAHVHLAAMAGHYKGTTHTFLDPNGGPPLVDEDTLYVEPALGGRYLRLQWFGSVGGKPRQGELMIAFHRDDAKYELSWIDTFHTGTAIMMFTGALREDGVVSVLGSYGPPTAPWGFRLDFTHGDAGIRLRALNITPDGTEYRAIETDFEPTYPSGVDD